MPAPQEFANWLSANQHKDAKYGWVYRYHSRSNTHSIALCDFILQDLLKACPCLQAHMQANKVISGINAMNTFPNGKKKNLDLAIGTPGTAGGFGRVLIACEAKTVMTEHGKSEPRVFDELSSSHEIVHQGDPDAIAAGITVVNIANTFISPLRQNSTTVQYVSQHKQPHAAEKMIKHLRGLPIRSMVGAVGFDAYATFVVDCDNVGPVSLWSRSPAPQPGDKDHYDTFLSQISTAYTTRFGP
jgi:hypothetical protein